jgi:hypothetical protein
VIAGNLRGTASRLDDLLVPAQNSHAVDLWLRRPTSDEIPYSREPDLGAGLGVLDVALGDADGDGRLDVFVADAFSDDVALILNRSR